jgi:superoxide dismutase, Fe-Mn family
MPSTTDRKPDTPASRRAVTQPVRSQPVVRVTTPPVGLHVPQYTLPDLDYDFGALEPHISGKIMELHHGKHHAAYVKNANLTIASLEEARAKDDFTHIAALEHALAFHLSGHLLHSILWKNMTPRGGDRPDGALARAIEKNFGSFERFRRQMTGAASTLMGSGWAALIWEPLAGRLLVAQVYDHQSNLCQGTVPLMVIDAWEHAYYLQYQDQKAAFFEAVWNLWNWKDIAGRFEAAQSFDHVVPGGAAG